MVNCFQPSIGLLLLSVSSATSLAEERQRGSLDVLLATPLPTRKIVWGKWWGTFRVVPWLAVLPGILSLVVSRGERWLGAILVVCLMLAYGAALTSLGLALATWVSRLGRAVTLTVAAYVLVAVGVPTIVITLIPNGPGYHAGPGLAAASPFFGIGYLTDLMSEQQTAPGWLNQVVWSGWWVLFYASFAALLLTMILLNFDRCLGRVAGRPGGRRPLGRPRPIAPMGVASE